MASHHGSFCWYELMTLEQEAAESFYTAVIGWGSRDAEVPDLRYTLMLAGQTPVAGIMTMPEPARAAGKPSYWSGFVAVDDVDASAIRVAALGGSIVHQPTDIPTIGRFALARDPQGAPFYLFKGVGDAEMPPALPTEPGYVGWRELYSSDHEAGLEFYSKLFGWTKSTTMDMGPMGVYQVFAHDGVDIGGMMNKPPFLPVSCWGYYFEVDAIGAATGRLEAAGGAVVNGPHQVPGGQWIVQARDAQGTSFSLVSRTP